MQDLMRGSSRTDHIDLSMQYLTLPILNWRKWSFIDGLNNQTPVLLQLPVGIPIEKFENAGRCSIRQLYANELEAFLSNHQPLKKARAPFK
ncbi:hypothetical protein ABFA07_005994 [Porites harrisoni]